MNPDKALLKQRGVTLIEILIVMVILALIASFAYPSYMNYVVDTKRTAATSILLQVADRQQQFFMDNKRFEDCVAVGGAWSGDHQEWQIPYGALVPESVDNVLAQHQVAHIGRGDEHALTARQPAGMADIEEAFDLLVATADCLHLAMLVDRTGHRKVLAQRQLGKRRAPQHRDRAWQVLAPSVSYLPLILR